MDLIHEMTVLSFATSRDMIDHGIKSWFHDFIKSNNEHDNEPCAAPLARPMTVTHSSR